MDVTFCQKKHVVRLLVKPPHIELPADVIRNHVIRNSLYTINICKINSQLLMYFDVHLPFVISFITTIFVIEIIIPFEKLVKRVTRIKAAFTSDLMFYQALKHMTMIRTQ